MHARYETRSDPLKVVALLLAIIGGLNWLLTAFGYNVVEALFGSVASSILTRLIYILIGLAAIYLIYPLYQMLTGHTGRPMVRP